MAMTVENPVLAPPAVVAPGMVQWSPGVLGALAAAALSFIMVTFGATIGLGVTSISPTWGDASAALWILSGFYLVLQAVLSFGFGGYIACRMRAPVTAATS